MMKITSSSSDSILPEEIDDNSKDNNNNDIGINNNNNINNIICTNTNQISTATTTSSNISSQCHHSLPTTATTATTATPTTPTTTTTTTTTTTETPTITVAPKNITKSEVLLFDYNFLTGHPNDNELPINEMNQILQQLSNSSCTWNHKCLQYGNSSGDVILRHEITNFVSRQCINDNINNISNIHENDNVIEDENDTNYNTLSNIEYIFCTTGISHGLDLILSCLCGNQSSDNTTIVYVEQPTYFLISQIFINHNYTIQYLPKSKNDNDNETTYKTFDINILKEQLEYYEINNLQHLIPKIICIIPTYHNPTGYTMSINDRYQLINICIQYHIILIADEVYHLLDWSTTSSLSKNMNTNTNTTNNINIDDHDHNHHRKPARMAAIYERIKHMKKKKKKKSQSCHNDDNDIMIISLWSLTKIWCPGIRFGWIECSNQTLHNLLCNYGYIASAGSCNPFTGEICKYLFQQCIIDQYIIYTLIPSYQKKCHIICQTIYEYNDKQKQLQQNGDYCIQLIIQPTGGYFIWLRLPNHINAKDFLHYCHQKKNNSNNNNEIILSSIDNNDDHHQMKTIHFMLGSCCDAIQMNENTNTNVNRQQQTQSSSSSLYDLSSYIRLCFVHMDIIKLQNGIHIFLQKFHHYCSITKQETIKQK